MLEGPPLEERQIFDSVVALFQTFESGGGRTHARTGIVLRQQAPYVMLDGATPAFLVWTVDADSRSGNAWEISGYDTQDEAENAVVVWLGSDRRISVEQLSPSALVVLMSQLTQSNWR